MKRVYWYVIATFCFMSTGCNSEQSKYDAAGSFEATEIIVSAETTGKLIQFEVWEGDTISAGKVVGVIDSLQLYLKKQQLEHSSLAGLSRMNDVGKQLAATMEQIAKQQTEKHRFEALVHNNAATQKQLDDIESQLLVLQKQLVAQRTTLEQGNKGVADDYEANLLQIAQLSDQLTKCKVIPLTKGRILAKYVQEGEYVTQGKPLFKMADMENMFLRVYLTSDQLAWVKVGQEVMLVADYGGESLQEYKGCIVWISDKAEFTPKGILTKNERANQVYAVKIAVKNDGMLKIGMYGQVKL